SGFEQDEGLFWNDTDKRLILGGQTSGHGRLRIIAETSDDSTFAILAYNSVATTGSDLLFGVDSAGNIMSGTNTADVYGFGSSLKYATFKNPSNIMRVNVISHGANAATIDMGNQSIRRATLAAIDGSHLAFFTNTSNSGTSLTERLRITNNGKLGIN